MRRGLILGALLLPALTLAPIARADSPLSVQVEVSFLLGFVEGSGCQFYRNGSWYDSKVAQEHLRDKYNYLKAKNLINTTEDFIARAATESSLSHLPYAVRCNGGTAKSSNQWLRDELARVRSLQ